MWSSTAHVKEFIVVIGANKVLFICFPFSFSPPPPLSLPLRGSFSTWLPGPPCSTSAILLTKQALMVRTSTQLLAEVMGNTMRWLRLSHLANRREWTWNDTRNCRHTLISVHFCAHLHRKADNLSSLLCSCAFSKSVMMTFSKTESINWFA